jgi:hypothetical protein
MIMIWQTINGQKFCREAVKALMSGKNVFMALPSPLLGPEFFAALDLALSSLTIGEIRFISASDYPEAQSLTELISQNLEPDENQKITGAGDLRELLTAAQDRYLFFPIVSGLSAWPTEAQARAARELSELASLTEDKHKGLREPEGFRIMLVASPDFPKPGREDALLHHYWWGTTAATDHEFLFDSYIAQSPPEEPAMFWWLKALCLSLGWDDTFIISRIVSQKPIVIEDITSILQESPLYSKDVSLEGWSDSLFFRGLDPKPGPPPQNPKDIALWAKGLISANHYSFIHPSLLSNDEDLLLQAISRGQRDVFFPLVDQIHGIITRYVTRSLGSGIFDHLIKDAKNRDDILYEIGPLSYFLSHNLKGQRSLKPVLNDLIDLANSWTHIRHMSAHNRIVYYDELQLAINNYIHCQSIFNGPDYSYASYKR